MRPHPFAAPLAAVLVSACACACAAPEVKAPAGADAQALAAAQAAERTLRVLEPMVRDGLAELEASRDADAGRLHLPSLDGVEADLALDALAGAVEGRPSRSGLDLAGKWLLARVRVHRRQARGPGPEWGGGFRFAPLARGPSPVEQAAASLHGVEESLLALQVELGATRRRLVSQRAKP